MTTADTTSTRDTRRRLPPGWRWARLGEVVQEAQLGFASGQRDPSGVLQLRMNNVTNRGLFDWSFVTRVPAAPDAVAAYSLRPGDVLFNNTNSTELVGKTALFEGHDEPVVFSNHFTRVRTLPDRLSPAFLALWLQARWQEGVFEDICNRWIGQSAVQRDKLLALEVPLAPLPEQSRIAAIAREQMAAVAQARAATEAQVEAAKALPAAYLRAVFGSPEAQQWPRRRLGALCELLPSKSIATDGDTDILAVTTACLTEGGFDPDGVKSARMWASDAAECVLSLGEVLIARSNTPELVGRAAMYEGHPAGAVASDLTIRIRPMDGLKPGFLNAYLSFLYVSGYWRYRAGGASGSMKKITRMQILEERVPIPSLDEQQRIETAVMQRMKAIERTRTVLHDQLAAIEALPGALLRRAFSGEL